MDLINKNMDLKKVRKDRLPVTCYLFCPGGHFVCGLELHVCVCPLPGSEELPGQVEPITSPLWFVQCPGVILAEALLIKNGLIAIPTAAAITTIIVDVVFVFMQYFISYKI
jgi:hypothetical protein